MASGDARRVWFPELIEALTAAWSPTLPWDELAALLAVLNERRKAIRSERGLRPPRFTCPGCGAASREDIPGISIRSALFALRKSGAVSEEECARLDASWQAHQSSNRLDSYGNPRPPRRPSPRASSTSCVRGHPAQRR